ncbi:hypothetical protein BXU10_07825 [Flavobacterium sp. LM4]|nr:hypothetical protein BXU10_07825 [Flavobacterium sp. LM4]
MVVAVIIKKFVIVNYFLDKASISSFTMCVSLQKVIEPNLTIMQVKTKLIQKLDMSLYLGKFLCGHGLQIRVILLRSFCISERSESRRNS